MPKLEASRNRSGILDNRLLDKDRWTCFMLLIEINSSCLNHTTLVENQTQQSYFIISIYMHRKFYHAIDSKNCNHDNYSCK